MSAISAGDHFIYVYFVRLCLLYCNARCQKTMKETSDGGATIWIQTLESSSKGLSNWMCWKHRRMKVKDNTILNPGALWTLESAQFSACDNFIWETWERQAGRQAGKQGGKGLGKTDTPSNKGKQEGRQAGRQAVRQGRQDLGKVGAPSNKGKQEGRQWETREGGHTIQQREARRETSWETRETRPREGGHTIQQRETRTKTSWKTSWETRPREDARTIQERETRMETSWETSW